MKSSRPLSAIPQGQRLISKQSINDHSARGVEVDAVPLD
jgi:hypothetical protein